MSDLGAIFHVKKGGVQYDAHAYTTTDECPEPNLKLTYKGQQAYVKLEAKGSGDVPCYVKKKDGRDYQVIKSAIPTGSFSLSASNGYMEYRDLTIPKGVKVVKVWATIKDSRGYYAGISGKDYGYLGVTPGKTYTVALKPYKNRTSGSEHLLVERLNEREWLLGDPVGSYKETQRCTISWSPEINAQTPKYTDYI